MNELYTEENIKDFSSKFSKQISEKLKDDLVDDFYNITQDYIYEHYNNFKDKIEGELISQITEEYIKEPTAYKFSKLRKKMFSEHKEELISILTDEAIKENVEKIIHKYTHKDYSFEWQWKDSIAQIILEKWDMFKDDERIKSYFGRELERKNKKIEYLEKQIQEINELSA